MRRPLPVLQTPPTPAAGSSPGLGALLSAAQHGPKAFGAAVPPSWPDSYGDAARQRLGFFTDTTLCIGCKACEVACKEWNNVPEDGYVWTGQSYDNTGALSANTWRHVAFIEQDRPLRLDRRDGSDGRADGDTGRDPSATGPVATGMRWLMASDVCKHCTDAPCLDVCPTGAIFRSEFGTVVVQPEVCNGCGYCVSACPFGVIDRRQMKGDPGHGIAQKCTLCYDRALDGREPACAQACPTQSIQWGALDDLRQHAAARLERVRADGFVGADLYGEDPDDGVGGFGAFFLLLDKPEVYGLPPDPVATTRDLRSIWGSALAAAAGLAALLAVSVVGGRR